MQICNIFFSLQGESTFAGLPCIFIRLAGCNLRCSYCDTPESFGPGKTFSFEQILSALQAYPCRLVEVTGGEPLLQPGTITLLQLLIDAGYQVLLETNGSLSLEAVPPPVHIITDVKLPGSGFSDCFLLSNLAFLQPGKDEIKFVIADRFDFDAAINFIELHVLHQHTLLFSPFTDKLPPHDLAAWVLQSGQPLRLQLQLHKLLNIL